MDAGKAILLVALAAIPFSRAAAGEIPPLVPTAPPAPLAPPIPPAQPAPPPAVAEPAQEAGGRAWVEIDPLIGWISGRRIPGLVTTSPPGTPRAIAGVEGFDTTRALFGTSTINQTDRFGLLLRAGYV